MRAATPAGPTQEKKKKRRPAPVTPTLSDVASGGRRNYRRPPPPAPPPRSDIVSGGRRDYRPPPPRPPRPAGAAISDVLSSHGYEMQQPTPGETTGRQGESAPPHPTLANLGIDRSLADFNQALDTTFASHQQAYGVPPSPNLALDIARSPLQAPEIPALFQVPGNPSLAEARGINLADRRDNPNKHFWIREDGRLDLPNPIAGAINKILSDISGAMTPPTHLDHVRKTQTQPHVPNMLPDTLSSRRAAPSLAAEKSSFFSFAGGPGARDTFYGKPVKPKPPKLGKAPAMVSDVLSSHPAPSGLLRWMPKKGMTPHEFQKKYPYISMSTLGVTGFSPDKLTQAFDDLVKTPVDPATANIIYNGYNLPQAEEFARQAIAGQLLIKGSTIRKQIVGTPPQNIDKMPAEQANFIRSAQQFIRLSGSAKYMSQFQSALQKEYPNWFGDLPTDGNFNHTWATRYAHLRSSADFGDKVTKQMASSNNLSVHDFLQAWRNKEHLMKTARLYGGGPRATVFIEHMPIGTLVHPHSMWGSSLDLMKYLTRNVGKGPWYAMPVMAPMTLAQNVLGLSGDLLAGGIDQYKAYGEAVGIILHHTGDIWGKGNGSKSQQQMKNELAQVLSGAAGKVGWAQLATSLAAGTPVGTGIDPLNSVLDIAGDIGTMGGPFTRTMGETVVPGMGEHAFLKTSRFDMGANAAYGEIASRGMGEGAGFASQIMGGGKGFIAKYGPMVEKGTMSRDEWKAKLAQLLDKGRIVGKDEHGHPVNEYVPQTEHDHPFPDLTSPDIPTKNPRWQNMKVQARTITDTLSDNSGVGGRLHGFATSARQLMAHASFPGRHGHIYDPNLDRRIYDYAIHYFRDPKLARQWRSRLVVAQGKQDIPAIQDLQQEILDKVKTTFTNKQAEQIPEPFKGTFITEAPSRFYLPTPGRTINPTASTADYLRGLSYAAQGVLNRIGAVQREFVVSGFPASITLLEKHAIADYGRALLGGMGRREIREMSGNYEDWLGMLEHDPNMYRQWAMFTSRIRLGEQQWQLAQNKVHQVSEFSTGDILAGHEPGKLGGIIPPRTAETKFPPEERFMSVQGVMRQPVTPHGRAAAVNRYMVTAAQYVRNMLNDPALEALSASTPDNLREVEQFILRDPDYRSRAFSEFEKTAKSNLAGPVSMGQRFATQAPRGKMGIEPWKLEAVKLQAQAMWDRYHEFVTAGKKAGIADPVREAKASYQLTEPPVGRGIKGSREDLADQKLADWLTANKLDFHVYHGLVQAPPLPIENYMQKLIKAQMYPNKGYRTRLGMRTFKRHYYELIKAGWDPKDAGLASMWTAEHVVKFHMLDFTDMLQLEQTFRWLYPFATKHRLYWKYLFRAAAQRPGLLVAAGDIKHMLDNQGNYTVNVGGVPFNIPVYHLTWINSNQYPDVNPAIGKLSDFINAPGFINAGEAVTATGGNVVTKYDAPARMWWRLWELHHNPTMSQGAAISGLTEIQKRSFFSFANTFSAEYMATHNGRIPPKHVVLQHAMLQLAFRGTMNAFTIIPGLLPYDPKAKADLKKQQIQYDKLLNNPAKYGDEAASRFLDAHPQLALSFHQTGDTVAYSHTLSFRKSLSESLQRFDEVSQVISDRIMRTGRYTPADMAQFRKAQQAHSKRIDEILYQDAKNWPGDFQYPKGKVDPSTHTVIVPGPLGVQFNSSKTIDLVRQNIHNLAPGMSQQELRKHAIGSDYTDTIHTIAVLKEKEAGMTGKRMSLKGLPSASQALARKFLGRDLPTVGLQKDQIDKVIRGLEDQASRFYNYPVGGPMQLQDKYYRQHVVPIRKKFAELYQLAKVYPSDTQGLAYSQWRAYMDAKDHPVTMTVKIDGKERRIRMASPVRIGFELSTPGQQQQTIAHWTADQWEHLPRFAKEKLGYKISPGAQRGWQAYTLIQEALKGGADWRIANNQLHRQFGFYVQPLPASFDTRGLKQTLAKVIREHLDDIKGNLGPKYGPEWYKDYQFSQTKKVHQLEQLNVGGHLDPRFQHILTVARNFNTSFKPWKTHYADTVKKAWRTGYLYYPNSNRIIDLKAAGLDTLPQLRAWVQQQPLWFQDLVVQQNPNFLGELTN